jgi:hypothetical protein
MRSGFLIAAAIPLLVACRPPHAAEPPLAVPAQPSGLKRCAAAPLDYPDADVPPPAHVSFASLPHDPVFEAMGISLVTFRSAELVFHASPDLPQELVDCTVAAADDAVAFVTRAFSLPRVFDGGPTRDVFLLRPDAAPDVLERLDPAYGFGLDAIEGRAFVGHPRGRRDAYAIFQWKKLPLSYLELGSTYAHEWTHMVQSHIRGRRPNEIDAVVEGEASLMGALFLDDVLPGASSFFWDFDARRLASVRKKQHELTSYELLTQPPHRHHDEATLFAFLSRSVDPATLAQVRLLARRELVDYESAWKRVVGRELVDPGIDAVVDDPSLAPRPALQVAAPVLRVVRNEDRLWFVAAGFKPRERATRVVRFRGQVDTHPVEADSRGVVAWGWRLGAGAPYEEREVEIRAESGACSTRYYVRGP